MATHAAGGFVERLRRAVGPEPSDAGLVEAYRVDRDEAAFAALVRRHGPMVLGVCRRVLRNEADAHDAFQATFLVLVRKVGSLRDPGRVSSWLYGVAYKTATKARSLARRRRECELASVGREPPESSSGGDDVAALLDAELAGLPELYRQPIVLCDLQGRTIKDAAGELGWPVGTAATRLTRGRARLAQRLLARGLGPTTAAVAAGVPAALLTSTVQAATGPAAASPAAAQLAEGVLRAMRLHKLTVWAAVVVAAGLVMGGVGRLALPAQAESPPTAAPPAVVAAKADPAPVPLAKLLEGSAWYPCRVDADGRTIDVSNDPPAGMYHGKYDRDERELPGFGPPPGRFVVKNLPVAPDARITTDGKPCPLDRLSVGPARLTFARDGVTISVIEATGTTPAPTLKAVDAAKGTITVQVDGGPTLAEMPVSAKATITVSDRSGRGQATVADLSAGMRARMVTAVEDGKLVAIRIDAWR